MVRGEDNDSTAGGSLRKRGRSRDQALVWIIKRIEMPPPDAERIVNSLELYPEIESALNRLKGELYKELNNVFVLGAARSWPIDKFRILCGGHYVDLLTLYRPLSGVEPSAQSAMMREFVEDVIRRPNVEYNSDWLKQAFPTTAPAAETSAAAANTETPVVKSEAVSPPPANTMTIEATTHPSEPPSEPDSERQSQRSGNPVWNWPGLVQHLKHLEKKKRTFNTKQDALEYYRRNVQRIDQMKAGEGPNPKTVRNVNKKFNFHQYVTIWRSDT
jgi:hypothetical protein